MGLFSKRRRKSWDVPIPRARKKKRAKATGKKKRAGKKKRKAKRSGLERWLCDGPRRTGCGGGSKVTTGRGRFVRVRNV
jgi:hypothetical protein